MQAKEVPGGLRRDTDLTGVEYIDTASSFMIGRCRTCQARKSTEPEYGMTSGPKAKDSHVKLFALVYLASGSAGGWLAVNSTPDASERRHQLHPVPSLHPIVAATYSPSGVTGLVQRADRSVSAVMLRDGLVTGSRPYHARPLRQWTLTKTRHGQSNSRRPAVLVQRLPVSLQLPVARPTSARADLYPIRVRARGVW